MKKKQQKSSALRLSDFTVSTTEEPGFISDLLGAVGEGQRQWETHVKKLQAENARLRRELALKEDERLALEEQLNRKLDQLTRAERVIKEVSDWANVPPEGYRHNDYELARRLQRADSREEVKQILGRRR